MSENLILEIFEYNEYPMHPLPLDIDEDTEEEEEEKEKNNFDELED